ncbi:MAG: glycosyl transferase [Pseudomonadota bacterium]
MSDFAQTGIVTTLHRLRSRPIEEIEAELTSFSFREPMALVLPSLFSELQGAALPRIVEELKHANYIDEIVVGLDQADASQFSYAKKFFAELPQRTRILWQDGPGLRALDEELAAEDLAPEQPGKGRNAWYCFGYLLSRNCHEVAALHDCDILTYSRELPARLLYPLANPNFDFKFCKGYYARITGDRLSGRVTRLFLTPLIRALKKIVGPMEFLEFLDAFRYPLSGEFSFKLDEIRRLRIPGDWGLEVGVLSEVYRNVQLREVCQVDIADEYDHKHQEISAEDEDKGLSRMSIEITKSIFRKLATEGVLLSNEFFRTVKATYFRIALEMLEQYRCDAIINGLQIDCHSEEATIEVFLHSIIAAGDRYLENPLETPFIPNWQRVFSAVPDFGERMLAAVDEDNLR